MSDTILNHFRISPVKPRLALKKDAIWETLKNPNLICGIELEIERVEHPYYVERDETTWRVTEDGSLRNNGREFISKPTALGKLVLDLETFFKSNNFTQEINYSDRTSTHVHVNVQDFTKEQIQSLIVLYVLFEKILFQFVGNHRSENIYCVPLTETMLVQNLTKTLDKVYNLQRQSWEKYTAFNLLPMQTFGTVEFRHLHGTNNLKTIVDWLQLVSSLVELARKTTVNEIHGWMMQEDIDVHEKLYSQVIGDIIIPVPEVMELFSRGLTEVKYLLQKGMFKESPVPEIQLGVQEPPRVNALRGIRPLGNAVRWADMNVNELRQMMDQARVLDQMGGPRRLIENRNLLLQGEF